MRNALKFWMIVVVLGASLVATNFKGFAHGGEDHGDKKPATTSLSAKYYAAEAVSDKYEILVKYASLAAGKPAGMTLFLSNALTNLPISGAQLKIINPEDAAQAFLVTPIDSGTYALQTQFGDDSKAAKLQVSVDGTLGPDLIQVAGIAFGEEKVNEAIAAEAPAWLQLKSMVAIVVALIIGLIVGLLIRRKPKVARVAMIAILLLAFGSRPFSNGTMAHGGEDHGKEVNPSQSNPFSSEFLTPKETQFLFEIETGMMNRNSMSSSLQLQGTIVPTASGAAVVQSPQSGTLKSLNVQVGQAVRKGQLLATVEQSVDANTQMGWITQRNDLEAEVEASKKNLDRLNSIRDLVAKKDIDEAKRRHDIATSNLEAFLKVLSKGGGSRLTPLFAPIDGKVERFNFSIGSTLNAGQDIFQISDLSKVYVEALVYESDLKEVEAGTEFLVSGKGGGRKGIPAKLVTLGQRVDETNQAQKTLFEVDNAAGVFRLGEYVTLDIRREGQGGSLSIPNAALVELNGKPAVFAKSSAERFTIRYLTVGEEGNTTSSVIEGIASDERIVTSGAYQLKMMYLNQ